MAGCRVAGVVVGVALLAAAPGVAARQLAESRTAPVKATADQLAFIAGAWSGTLNDRVIEQHWTVPAAGSMVAMYRSIRDGKPTLYELLAIEEEAGGLVLRIKHFKPGPGLASQEARDESVDHRLVRVNGPGRTAVFEGGTPASPSRVTFTSPDPQTLTITVERQRDGKTVSTDFKYTRLPPPGRVGG